jgi:hypothetical protein
VLVTANGNEVLTAGVPKLAWLSLPLPPLSRGRGAEGELTGVCF